MTATSTVAALVARTRPVDPPGRLLDALAPDGFAWLRDGNGFVTAGVAARVPAPLAGRALAGIEWDWSDLDGYAQRLEQDGIAVLGASCHQHTGAIESPGEIENLARSEIGERLWFAS